MALELEEVSGRVIGSAIEVHRRLGPGFLESIYLNALCLELCRRGMRFEREAAITVRYAGMPVGAHRLDLLVADRLVVELKAIKSLENVHFAVVRSYLRAAGLDHGLLLNFSKLVLEARRVSARAGPASPRFLVS